MERADPSLPKDGCFQPQESTDHCSAVFERSQSIFGRLIYLACRTEKASTSCELRTEHQRIFEEWLALPLQDKQADLGCCSTQEGYSLIGLVRHWIHPGFRERLIPSSALAPQRELFILELEVLFLVV